MNIVNINKKALPPPQRLFALVGIIINTLVN